MIHLITFCQSFIYVPCLSYKPGLCWPHIATLDLIWRLSWPRTKHLDRKESSEHIWSVVCPFKPNVHQLYKLSRTFCHLIIKFDISILLLFSFSILSCRFSHIMLLFRSFFKEGRHKCFIMSHFILAHLGIIWPLYEHFRLEIALFTEISKSYLMAVSWKLYLRKQPRGQCLANGQLLKIWWLLLPALEELSTL